MGKSRRGRRNAVVGTAHGRERQRSRAVVISVDERGAEPVSRLRPHRAREELRSAAEPRFRFLAGLEILERVLQLVVGQPTTHANLRD
jgi:hypothetical protein